MVAMHAAELENITIQLKALQPQAKLLFAGTTAYMCSEKQDGCVVNLNNQAAAIMARHGIPMINLHDAITTGACPYNRPCAQQYVGKSQSCMVISGRLIGHAPV